MDLAAAGVGIKVGAAAKIPAPVVGVNSYKRETR